LKSNFKKKKCFFFQVANIFQTNPQILSDENQLNPNPCHHGSENGRDYLMIDMFIDAYVMVRFLQILHKSQSARNRSYIFTLVMYWNLLNALTALWYHMLVGLNTFEHSPYKHVALIALSYLVSIDTENKRVINMNIKDQM
jgi:hypothetical protein